MPRIISAQQLQSNWTIVAALLRSRCTILNMTGMNATCACTHMYDRYDHACASAFLGGARPF